MSARLAVSNSVILCNSDVAGVCDDRSRASPYFREHSSIKVIRFAKFSDRLRKVSGLFGINFGKLDLSRLCAAPSSRLSPFPFESDGAFHLNAECRSRGL